MNCPDPSSSNGFVPQRSEVAKIAAGSATEIKDTVGRVTLYGIEQCRVILADIVVSRAVPEGSGEPIVKRDRRLAEAADLFRITWFLGAAHQSACLSRSFIVPYPSSVERLGTAVWNRPLRGRSHCSAGVSRKPTSLDRLGRRACGRGTAGAGACP